MTSSTIYGLILAGGESLRMGSDKSLLSFYGKPQREYLFDLLSTCCDKVYTSCNTKQQVPAQLNPLPDQYDFKGPLNAILTAFQHKPDTAWLTIPVDMPFIDKKIIDRLIKDRQREKVATCYFDSDGKFPEPLFALWEPHALPLLLQYHETGKYTPRGFLMSHDAAVLASPDRKMHTNINSVEEFERFRKGSR